MATTFYRVGARQSGSQPVLIRTPAAAIVAVVAGGLRVEASTNPLVMDGTVVLTVPLSGPVSGRVLVNGVDIGGVELAPKATGAHKSAWISCQTQEVDGAFSHYLNKLGLHHVSTIGDTGYTSDVINDTTPRWGELFKSIRTSATIQARQQDLENLLAFHRQISSITGNRKLLANTPMLCVPDDHDYPVPDNHNNTPAQLNKTAEGATINGAWTPLQADVDAVNLVSNAAFDIYYHQTNPDGARVNIGSGTYFNGFSYAVGPALYIHIDCTSDRVGATGDMLSAQQEQWLYDELAKPGYDHYIVLSPKEFLQGVTTNDTWVNHGTQRNRIKAHIAGLTTKCVTVLAGDRHNPIASFDPTSGIYHANSSSCSHYDAINMGSGYMSSGNSEWVRWKVWGYEGLSPDEHDQFVGICDVRDDGRMFVELHDVRRPHNPVRHRVERRAGSQAIFYQRPKIG